MRVDRLVLTDSAAGAPEQIVQGLAVGSGVYAALSALNWLRNSDWSNADAHVSRRIIAEIWVAFSQNLSDNLRGQAWST